MNNPHFKVKTGLTDDLYIVHLELRDPDLGIVEIEHMEGT